MRVADRGDMVPADQSDTPFTIAGIELTAPDGGETWYYRGTDQDITWLSGGVPAGVDIYYSETHGGAWNGRAVWAMWNDGSLASSNQMWLGNENQGLSILSTYACATLKHDGIVSRYDSVMAGGLRYTTGSHDKFYDGLTTDEVGEDYADNLKDGDSIRYAWRDGVSDWYHDQDATVMTTGTNASDCSSRRSGMRWTNYNGYPRRTSGNIGYYCWTWWNNL